MKLSEVAITRPVLATVINVLLVVLGLFALQRLPVRQYPAVEPPVVTVNTRYPGAAAPVVETEVTKPLEAALSAISGIRLLKATSFEEASSIEIEFTTDRNVELAAADVRDEIGRAIGQLPEEADDPVVVKESASDRPMMWLTLLSDNRDQSQLTDYALRNIIDPVSVINGVSRVIIGGERRFAMRVWLDRQAMTVRGITVPDIIARLEQENIEIPAGRLESTVREISLRVNRDMRQADDFANLVIRDNEAGRVVLGDIASIEVGAENYRTALWVNGKNAIGLGIVRQSQSNALAVATDVKARLELLRTNLPPEIELQVSYDESIFIEESRDEVLTTIAIAFALVVLVILIFLRSPRATLIPTLSIPVSLIAGALVMLVLGFSINVLTLLAAVLAIGLVVDDTIVVLENIHRRIELGEPPLLAAVRGTQEVGFAVIATTAVLVAVFVPIAFRTDSIGLLFNEFGLTLAGCVVFSSFVALTWAPMLCAKWLKRSKRATEQAAQTESSGAHGSDSGFIMRWIESGYRRFLKIALAPWGLVSALAVTLVVLGLMIVLYRAVPSDPVPTEDTGYIFGIFIAPEGSSIGYSSEQMRQAEDVFLRYIGDEPDKPADRMISIIAPSLRPNASPNAGFMILRLKHWDDRQINQQALVDEIKPQMFGIPGALIITVNRSSFPGVGFGQPFQVAIGADDHPQAGEWADTMLGAMRQSGLFARPDKDVKTEKPQLTLSIDRDRAADLGVSTADIGRTLQVLMGALDVTDYEDRGRNYEVMLQAQASDRDAPNDLDNLFVRSATSGQLISLVNMVSATEVGAPNQLRRIGRQPSVTVEDSLLPGVNLPTAMAWFEQKAAELLPPAATLTWLGQARQANESSQGGMLTFALALLVVFLVLAAQFESWIHPIIIILTVPLAVAGALLGLYIGNIDLNIYAQIGIIMLVGLMAKNAILMVEFANQLRDRGHELLDAIREAAVLRLRPIIMTSVATTAGAIPLAISSGAGAEGRIAIGAVVIAGTIAATVLTLVVIPAFYLALARFTQPAGTLQRRLAQQTAQHKQ